MKASTIFLLAASAVAVHAQADPNVEQCIIQCALGVSPNPLDICESEDLQKKLLECAGSKCNLDVNDEGLYSSHWLICHFL